MSSQQHNTQHNASSPVHASETYTCTKIKTLIDLNTNATNFKSFFSAKSENNEPFYLVIIDQDALDSGKDMEFNNVTSGEISGEIVADKNEYKNYLLVLKSDVPTIVRLDTTFERLPDYISPSASVASVSSNPFSDVNFTPSLNKILAGLLVAVILILFMKKYLNGAGVVGGKNSLLDKLKKINK